MIESTLEFQYQPSVLRSIVAMFCALPEGLRPTHHSLGEDEVGEPILDVEIFLDSLAGAKLGPFLRGANVMYDVRLAGNKPNNEAVEKANFREKLLCNLLIYSVVILAF